MARNRESQADEPEGKVSNRLPRRPRLKFGPYTLIPKTSISGRVIEDWWCVPGCRVLSTNELSRMARRVGVQVRVLQ